MLISSARSANLWKIGIHPSKSAISGENFGQRITISKMIRGIFRVDSRQFIYLRYLRNLRQVLRCLYLSSQL